AHWRGSHATMSAPRVARVPLPLIRECVVASLARQLAEQLIAIHELPGLDALDTARELGLLLGGELEPLVIFSRQDRYSRALLQGLAFDLDPAGDDLAGDQLHRFTSGMSVPRPTWSRTRGARRLSPISP